MSAPWPGTCAVLFQLALALPLYSQAVPPAEAALAPLVPHGKVVRLRAEQARITGRLIAAGGGAATLDTTGGTRVVLLETIDSIWVRGRAWKTGAVIGGVTGMVALGVFTGLVVHATCETSECGTTAAALAGGGLGLAGGALVGAGIGALFPKWKRRYP